jgi:hypothetical protein
MPAAVLRALGRFFLVAAALLLAMVSMSFYGITSK